MAHRTINVRYHNRYVDRDAWILYILTECCGCGDLSTIIKQATKQNRPIPEDTIWYYSLQTLQVLHHCYHLSGHSILGSGSTITCSPTDLEGGSRRVQILHWSDLKHDNSSSSSTARTVVSLIIYCPPAFIDELNSDILAFQSHSHRRVSQAPALGYIIPKVRSPHTLTYFERLHTTHHLN